MPSIEGLSKGGDENGITIADQSQYRTNNPKTEGYSEGLSVQGLRADMVIQLKTRRVSTPRLVEVPERL